MTATHSTTLRHTRLRLALAAIAALCAGAFAFASPAAAGTPTNMAWSVSNNQVSATGVTYNYSFTAATTGTIASVTFVVSGAGLAGTPTVGRNFGIPAGTVAISGQTITYTVTTPISITAGTPMYLSFSGLTNSSTIGSYTTVITTRTSVPATIDTGTSPAVTLAAKNTAITVSVAQSLTFTINKTAFELDMDPSLPALADQTASVGLTVQTNANSGYTLAVADAATGLQSTSTGNPIIPDVSAGKAASVVWPGAPHWGYTVTGTGATIDAAFSGSKYAGYISGGETIATRATATGASADTITIANRVAIDYAVTSGVYSDTITYTVTPNYS
jgi:hypothetical protein